MSVKLSDLSKKLNLSLVDLKEKLKAHGVVLKASSRVIDDEVAQSFEETIKTVPQEAAREEDSEVSDAPQGEKTTVKVYEEFI